GLILQRRGLLGLLAQHRRAWLRRLNLDRNRWLGRGEQTERRRDWRGIFVAGHRGARGGGAPARRRLHRHIGRRPHRVGRIAGGEGHHVNLLLLSRASRYCSILPLRTHKCLGGPGYPDPPKQEKRGEGDNGIISYL